MSTLRSTASACGSSARSVRWPTRARQSSTEQSAGDSQPVVRVVVEVVMWSCLLGGVDCDGLFGGRAVPGDQASSVSPAAPLGQQSASIKNTSFGTFRAPEDPQN